MGDGRNLRKILDEQGKSVRWLAGKTSINSSTLFSIIRKDSNIRYDYALKIANVLHIKTSDICSDKELFDYIEEEKINDILIGNRFKKYINETMNPLLNIFGIDEMSRVHENLINYYQLNDEGRSDVDQLIRLLMITKKDKERAKEIKELKLEDIS